MLVPLSVADVMNDIGVWWAVAGGWAIDLWLGEQTREHHDIEVVVRRSDQSVVHAALCRHWQLWSLDPPGSGWGTWEGHSIAPPAFQLQARSPTLEFDIFTETVDDATWRFRRDERITRPVSDVTVVSGSAIPILRPEIQLLYMACSSEPKNQHDFDITRPRLGPDAASWLVETLAICYPGHRWTMAS